MSTAQDTTASGTPGRLIDMWPVPDVDAEHERTREAVRAVLRRFEPSMIVSDELADELIAAAQTGV